MMKAVQLKFLRLSKTTLGTKTPIEQNCLDQIAPLQTNYQQAGAATQGDSNWQLIAFLNTYIIGLLSCPLDGIFFSFNTSYMKLNSLEI